MSELQDHRMRRILTALEMLPHIRSSRFDPPVTGGERSFGYPPGEGSPDFLLYRKVYGKAWNDGERERIIRDATEALETAKKGNLERFKVKGESPEELSQRIVRDFAGWPARMVADKVRTTVNVVRLARKGARLDEESGDPPKGVPKIDNEERAVKMRERGLSFRAIEMNTGIPKSTVERLCNRRAA